MIRNHTRYGHPEENRDKTAIDRAEIAVANRIRQRHEEKRKGSIAHELAPSIEPILQEGIPSVHPEFPKRALILDRSGSMSQTDDGARTDRITLAENYAASLLLAYEMAGQGEKISLYSVYMSSTRIDIPLAKLPSDELDEVFTGEHNGGAPISDAMSEALEWEKPETITVLTDGVPDNGNAVKELIEDNPNVFEFFNYQSSVFDIAELECVTPGHSIHNSDDVTTALEISLAK